jgi:hypothetical protein
LPHLEHKIKVRNFSEGCQLEKGKTNKKEVKTGIRWNLLRIISKTKIWHPKKIRIFEKEEMNKKKAKTEMKLGKNVTCRKRDKSKWDKLAIWLTICQLPL